MTVHLPNDTCDAIIVTINTQQNAQHLAEQQGGGKVVNWDKS